MNRVQFQKLAQVRIEEAQALFDARKYDGAYYLAGYAVECGFKACVAGLTKKHDFPEKDFVKGAYTHDFEILIRTAELGDPFKLDLGRNARLKWNWEIVKDWKEDGRYNRWTRDQARAMIEAISETPHGVLSWIKQYW